MRIICFYLPQYHPIPENDAWWGPGFTDWVNVARCRPRFRGHHQPQIPGELGFYDLRLAETREAQARLAEEHGIGGFCYYHYWFNGKLLLEKPFEAVLASGRPALPFCLAWANENWTRSWDGEERRILVRQDYEAYDPELHLDWLARAFQDPRHLRVGEAPIFLVYNPSRIPSLPRVVEAWRRRARGHGLPGLYLVSVLSHQNSLGPAAARGAGFDASVEFFPHPSIGGRRRPLSSLRTLLPRAWNRAANSLDRSGKWPRLPVTNVFSYRELAEAAMDLPPRDALTFPCVIPGWDNSPRRRVNASVFQNDDPPLYGRWLRHALARAAENPPPEQIVFVNAWNEWGEGCHLEPDLRHGRRFLEETRAAASAVRGRASDLAPSAVAIR